MPNKATMQTKNKWKDDFTSIWLAEVERLGLDPSNHMSPTFKRGGWKVGIEHQRQFDSVVLRWIANPQDPPRERGPFTEENECGKSDKKKGWFYRIRLQPSGLNELLQKLDSIKP